MDCEDPYNLVGDHCEYIEFIPNCIWHINVTECYRCDANYFFKSTPTPICSLVPLIDLIEGCIYYDSDKKCIECDSDYGLNEGICIHLE